MQISVMKPGLLVSLSVRIKGGVSYQRVDIEPEHEEGEGRKARWETSKYVQDAAEFDRAEKARSLARSRVVKECATTSGFGLLCLQARQADLDQAIAEARAICEEHNKGAACTRVELYAIVGRIAETDEEATRAIAAEVRGLLEQMANGVKAADPEAIREAASKAKALGSVLSEDVAGKVGKAIEEARRAAREIVAKVGKAGESAAEVVARCSVKRIEEARFAFLDLEGGEMPEESAPIAGRGVDLEPAAHVSASPIMSLPLEV